MKRGMNVMEKGKSGSRNVELMEMAEKQLRWYTEEAPDEEFDDKVVDALVNLVVALKPSKEAETKTDEEELSRFWEYVKQREADTEGTEAAGTTIREFKSKGRQAKKRNIPRISRKTQKILTTAATIVLVVLVAGCSLGVANAYRGNGFFYWLSVDDEGMSMLTMPEVENMDESMTVQAPEIFFSEEEVPKEFQEYLVDNQLFSQIEEYRLKYVSVLTCDNFSLITQAFVDESGENRVSFSVKIYEANGQYIYESFMCKESQIVEGNQGVEEGLVLREDPHGREETEFFFFVGNKKYMVEGNVEKETIVEIAEAYREMVLNP